MNSMARPERTGVVLRHPDRPVPSRRRLLLSATPAMGFIVLAGLSTTWWVGRNGSQPPWFPLGWIPLLGTAWLVLSLSRISRPSLARAQQRKDVTAARQKALHEDRLPESPSVRIGAAARSCDQLETMMLLTATGLTIAVGAILRPGLPWLLVLTGWGVLSAASLPGAGRSWAYLRLHEHDLHPPTF